jgi:hypothetical protein
MVIWYVNLSWIRILGGTLVEEEEEMVAYRRATKENGEFLEIIASCFDGTMVNDDSICCSRSFRFVTFTRDVACQQWRREWWEERTCRVMVKDTRLSGFNFGIWILTSGVPPRPIQADTAHESLIESPVWTWETEAMDWSEKRGILLEMPVSFIVEEVLA